MADNNEQVFADAPEWAKQLQESQKALKNQMTAVQESWNDMNGKKPKPKEKPKPNPILVAMLSKAEKDKEEHENPQAQILGLDEQAKQIEQGAVIQGL